MESPLEIPRPEKRPHLLLFPAPFQGHINPMLQLAYLLHSKGFSITIFHTQFNSPNPSNHPNFDFIPINDGLSDAQISIVENFIEFVSIMNANCRVPFHDRLARMLSEKKNKEKIRCIISDVIMSFTQDAASHFNIQRIVLRTNAAAFSVVTSSVNLLRQKGYFDMQLQDPQSEAPVHELTPLRVKDIPEYITVKPDILDQFGATISKLTCLSSGMIFNSLDDLEQTELVKLQRGLAIPFFPIGPLYKRSLGSSTSLLEEDRNRMEWLNKQEPVSVLYISFGSLAVIEKTELEEIAWGLADSEQPFLWVLRHDSVHGLERIELPQGFEEKTAERGLIVKWAPQLQVLGHTAVGGFWTHNGWNSTLESMGEGVPMLCSPNFGDQKVNARYVSQVWKVGIQLEGRLEREEMERAIRRLMLKEGNEIRERAKELKEAIVRSVSVGGSCMALENLIKCINSM